MAAKLMHAVQYNSYGGGPSGLKHVEIPIPTPKKDEVLLKLEAVSINPVDWTIQSGLMRPFFPSSFPHTPVSDVAGEVVEVGQDVRKFKVGNKVVAFLTLANGGGFAEFATARESSTALRPSEVSAAEAAALPVAATTALKCLTEVAGIKLDGTDPAKNILIAAASGGVGHYAVQLAKLGNHHVTATCGARNFDFVKSLGADEVLDYKTSEGAALKSPSELKYDAIIDCTAGIAWSVMKRNLSPNGKAVAITFGPKVMMTYVLQKVMCSKKKLVPLMTFRKAHYLEYLVGLIKEGKLKTIFDSRYPLSKAEEAWAKSISGHATGKIVVEA